MTVHVTPEMIQKFEAERKAKLAIIQQQNQKQDQEIQAEKARAEAFWNNKKQNLPVGTPQTDQKCGDCNATIPAGTPAKYAKRQAVYGSDTGLKRVYLCNKCMPLTEAPKA
jgi:hypothetical protein